jgi:hypothetical protein
MNNKRFNDILKTLLIAIFLLFILLSMAVFGILQFYFSYK